MEKLLWLEVTPASPNQWIWITLANNGSSWITSTLPVKTQNNQLLYILFLFFQLKNDKGDVLILGAIAA